MAILSDAGPVLIVNAGSSSIKLSLFNGKERKDISAQGENTAELFTQLVNEWNGLAPKQIGHRVVHGGSIFYKKTLINAKSIEQLEQLSSLAPLHNPPALATIMKSQSLFPQAQQYAFFDTAFHRTMPPYAEQYAIAPKLASKYGIKRYGFHGLAHASLWKLYREHIGPGKIITAHLGSGCSIAAIDNGRSIDTTMGFTPLEGVAMRTRSGDIDPTVVPLLQKQLGISGEDVINILNKESGIAAMIGSDIPFDRLYAIKDTVPEAQLAIDLFCYRIAKAIGAYIASLKGIQSIIFSGGIGQNVPQIREQILQSFEWYGIHVERGLNESVKNIHFGDIIRISTGNSAAHAFVMGVDENRYMYEMLCTEELSDATPPHPPTRTCSDDLSLDQPGIKACDCD